MASSSTSSEEREIATLLQGLRDRPADNAAAEPLLPRIFSFLTQVSPTPSGQLHWFCDKASETTVGAASFLIRLYAFKGPSVQTWKQGFRNCVSSCAFCVESLECIKATSRSTYFGAYQDSILRSFFENLENWELDVVLEDLETAGFIHRQAHPNGHTLADAPPQLVFRMLANWTIFTDSRIQHILHTFVPPVPIAGWPQKHPPPGMLILLMDESAGVRDWARRQCLSAEPSVMSCESFNGSYAKAFEAIVAAIQQSPNFGSPNGLSFSSDNTILWSTFSTLLRLVPVERLAASRDQPLDLRRFVTGHLHDNGAHFVHVLKSLILLLKRLSTAMWTSEAENYPKVVFDSVKDNPTFLSLLESSSQSADRQTLVAWIPELLHTIQQTATYGGVLAKAVDFLCEELQHERFKDTRPMVMKTGIQLLASAHRRSEKAKDLRHDAGLQNTLDIHGSIVVAVAFDRRYSDDSWKDTRASARALIETILASDTHKVLFTIESACRSLAQVVRKASSIDPIPALSIRAPIWKAVYSSIQPTDVAAISSIITTATRVSHLTPILAVSYKRLELVEPRGEGTIPGSKVIAQINEALKEMQTGFLEVISKFADYNLSSTAVEMISRPNVGKAVVLLLLSPIPDFQTAGQTIVGLAFDKDVRADCFEALMYNDKRVNATFDGLIEFLSTFERYAPTVPEACDFTRSLVRCFNDVLDVLCSTPNGRLLDPAFLRPEDPVGPTSRLLELWKKLTNALTIIFKRTVGWAEYYKAKELTVWMRDAIILCKDLVVQWRVVEGAAVGSARQPSKGLSEVGSKIVETFQTMLPELGKWLRLTDEELLYQTLAVVRQVLDIFNQTNKRPAEETLGKLQKYIRNAKSDSTKSKSRLDAEGLMKLESALAPFVDAEEEDEVQIVKHVKAEPAPKKPKRKEAEVEIVPAPAAKKPVKDEVKLTPHQQQLLLLNKKNSGKRPLAKPAVDARQSTLRHTSLSNDEAKIQAASAVPSFRRAPAPVASSSKVPIHAKAAPQPAKVAKDEESDSSAEESDEDDDPAAQLAALASNAPPTPKIKKPQERRSVKMLDMPMKPSAMQERMKRAQTQRNTALRLRPDVSSLHKVILSWDYNQSGNQPPLGNTTLGYVPSDFTNYEQYRRIFEPLLLTECWGQIQQQKQEAPPTHPCTVVKKQYVDVWIDFDLSFTHQVPKDWNLTEVDIVLLSTPDKKNNIMAKVTAFKRNPMGTVASIRCVSQGPAMVIDMQSTFVVRQLYSLSTINREYGALMSLPYINYCDYIMKPMLARAPSIKEDELARAMTSYGINRPQAVAILSAMSSEGFVLIQGPPGTGKTSTICALVSRFMSERPRPIRVPGKDKEPPPPKAKILICAPSNAAIDEIAQRLVARSNGKLSIVRLGAEGSINDEVKAISLDALVRKKVEAVTGQHVEQDLQKQIKELSGENEALKRARDEKLQELTNLQDNFSRKTSLENEAQSLRMKRQSVVSKLNELRDKVKSENRSMETLRRQMRREVIQEADVVCSTLSGSGHEVLIEEEFEMVVIDEAAQAVELSSIIPLKYNCVRCVMVGDPQQLPPTVISQEASRRKYDQSLFLRLFNQCPNAVHLLSIQYRMHPDISRLPSEAFYQGRIEDGPDMEKLTARPWHSNAIFGKYRFFNVGGNEEPGESNSLRNKAEAQAAKALYARLSRQYASVGFAKRIGIISMYRAQVNELRYQFRTAFGVKILEEIDFGTVDGFQGQEKDIIILSCVRAGPGVDRIGFLADVRRLNVAITRAKSSLFILGNAPTLERSDQVWKQLITDARARGSMINVDSNTFTQPNVTTSTIATSVEPARKKARVERSTPKPSNPPIVPPDLAPPKALKESMARPATSAISATSSAQSMALAPVTLPVEALKDPPQMSSKSVAAPAPSASTNQIDGGEQQRQSLKRAAEVPSGSSTNVGQAGARPPPAKKPKTGGMSMFIPKKPLMKK